MITKHRTIRISDELWESAKAKADEDGRTITDVIRQLLMIYLDDS